MVFDHVGSFLCLQNSLAACWVESCKTTGVSYLGFSSRWELGILSCRWGAEHLLLLGESWWGLQLIFRLRLGPGWERRLGNLPSTLQVVSGNPVYIFPSSLLFVTLEGV